MAGIRLEWAQFGDFDSFDLLRSDMPMDINSLPSPIAVNLLTMYYVDTAVNEGDVYHYRVVAHRDGVNLMSDEIIAQAALDDDWNSVVMLLRFNSNYADESVKDTYSKKGNVGFVAGRFGDAAELLPTSSGSVNGLLGDTIGNSSLSFNAGDFTIELFVKPYASYTQNSQALISLFNTHAYAGWQLYLEGLKPVLYKYDNGGSSIVSSSTALSIDNWYHVAACRISGITSMYVNGILVGSAADSSDYKSTDIKLSIGYQAYGNARYPFKGAIDELRITKGLARYTANFSAPNKPFSSN